MGLSGWLTQLVKCLLCKQKDPSLVPRTHTNKPGLAVNVCSSSATEVKSAELLSWMPSQCILIMELQASERPCPPPKKSKSKMYRMSNIQNVLRPLQHLLTCLLVHTGAHAHTHTLLEDFQGRFDQPISQFGWGSILNALVRLPCAQLSCIVIQYV